MAKKINKAIDQEMLNKGKDIIKDFDFSQSIKVKPKKVENKLISIRLPMGMIKSLRYIAKLKGDIGYQQIIKTYIAEGLLQEQYLIHQSIEKINLYDSIENSSSSTFEEISFKSNKNIEHSRSFKTS